MTWLRIDDAMPDHPKIVGLSHVAFRAHVEGLCYCAKHLTDGFVPAPAASKLAKKPVLAELEKARLWTRKRGGFVIKNYLEYNPSKAKVEAERAQRSQKARAAADARWHARSNAPSIDSIDAPIPIPSRTNGHTSSSVVGLNDHKIKAEDLDPATLYEIQRILELLPDNRSTGRLVKLARSGKPARAFADARQGLQTVSVRPSNPGAWVCRTIEGYAC